MNRLTQLFPVIAGAASMLALLEPRLFTWFGPLHIKVALALIMFFTGLSLTTADFRRVARRPGQVAAGFLLQYSVMPAMGYFTALAFALPAELAAGLILVSCCPGGTASNVITFLAKADVPLSVTMTAVSTLAAAVFTPALSAWLIGARIPVDVIAMARDTALVILLPIAFALGAKRLLPHIAKKLEHSANFLAVLAITLIVASIIGSSRAQILSGGFSIVAAVFTLHAGGFLLGYLLSRLLRIPEIQARTISIEVGMQNSGLGVVLAVKHLTPLAAVPCAVSSLMHSLIGSLLASVFSRRPPAPNSPAAAASDGWGGSSSNLS
jgi:BASS family bile acid:Na+ symporter